MTDLTGKTAFRHGRGGCLILQVQERYVYTTYDNGLAHSEDATRWRDATVRDITMSDGEVLLKALQEDRE